MASGNPLADRRMEMARALRARGDRAAAAELLEQAVDIAPAWAEGWFLLGEWLQADGRRGDAVAAYARCLGLDAADRLGAVLRLALLGAVAAPPAMPPAYVAGVFDECAGRFDEALLGRLAYSVPAGLHALVAARAGADAAFARALDLGCGTGLAGERFRAACAWLEGVDLSAGMIARARRKGLYDLLATGDALGALADAPAAHYDLVLAADVLVYFGELGPLMGAVARVLMQGGRFAFSTEALAGDAWRLTAGHRFAHGGAYLRAVMDAAGLAVEAMEETVCRKEAGRDVAGWLVLARRPAALSDSAAADDAPRLQSPGKALH
jgi:predicted TPR repeat methyltransferase